MEALKKARTAVRSAFTRTVTELRDLTAQDAVDKVAVRLKFQKFQRVQDQLVDWNLKIQDAMVADNVDEPLFELEQQQKEKYEDEWLAVSDEMKPHLEEVVPKADSSAYESLPKDDQKRNFKLPKIEVKKFNGELTEWLSFWSQFQKIHEDQSLHQSDKFQYLSQAMVPGTRAEELVNSYPQTSVNYPKVIKALEERFGRKKLLKQVYVRELLKLVVHKAKSQDRVKLSSMYDKLESHLRALESLEVTLDQTAEFLYPMVESSLPEDILIAWQRSPLYAKDGSAEIPPKTELDYLMQFLRQEVESEEQRNLARAGFGELKEKKPSSSSRSKSQFKGEDEAVPTVAGLHIGEKLKCLFCDKSHDSEQCGRAQSMSLEDRIAAVKKANVCYTCLRRGHWTRKCKTFVKCPLCEKKHKVIMCPDLQQMKETRRTNCDGGQSTSSGSAQQFHANFAGSSAVFLGTFRTTLVNGNKKVEVRALYDPGAQRSYISTEVADRLSLRVIRQETISHCLFGGVSTAAQSLRCFNVSAENKHGGLSTLSVLEKDKICGYIPRLPRGPWMKELKKRGIWVSDMSSDDTEVQLLVGADMFGKLLTGRVVQLQEGLTALETLLGWIVMGAMSSAEQNGQSMAMSVINLFVSEASPEDLWSLEAIGIRDSSEVLTQQQKEEAVKEHFAKTVSRDVDGRYSVRLPWIDEEERCPNNRRVAEARLASATGKLKSMGKYNDYDSIFDAWVEEGIVEVVKPPEDISNTCHYLPHRAVLKPESKTTPIRPVYDASCKTGRQPSLNDCLAKGPNLLEHIPSILLRFRERKVGVISDIRKAFLMIGVAEEDRDFLRFLWWEKDGTTTKVMRHSRVVFGVNCSPYLLAAVLTRHLEKYQDGKRDVAMKLLLSLYVDNSVTSVNSYLELDHFRMLSVSMMAEAKMELRQWEWSLEDSEISPLTSRGCGLESGDTHVTSVLGYSWDKQEDTMSCRISSKNLELLGTITRRTVLSKVQQVFDPMGFLSPAMLQPKLILQQAWKNKEPMEKKKSKKDDTWDLELHEDLQDGFQRWWSQVKMLMEVKIPRWMRRTYYKEELHTFCDASGVAYAAVVFLRVETNERVHVTLLQAKSRVAPLKKQTIPRLELLSCTIAARLAKGVKTSLELMDIPSFYWNDSSTCLAWIRRYDVWGTFVGNRVREICSISSADSWRHVPGVMNPADLPSRGCTPEELLRSRWWEGPAWLYGPREDWPSVCEDVDEEEVRQERKKKALVAMNVSTIETPWYARRYSNYSSNVRLMGWILRYVRKLAKKSNQSGNLLTQKEVDEAELKMFSLVQQEAFEDKKTGVISGIQAEEKDGVYYVKTRLMNRTDTPAFKKPVVLPTKHPLVEQLIREEHQKNKHAGVQFLLCKLRERVWILQGRRAVKAVIGKCVTCRRFTTKPPTVPEAPLPADRVKDCRAFQVTGVDLAGPLFLKDKTKVWIVLFTCANIRAVHLEMVTSLSAEAFILALYRFIGRRGRPSKLYTDNGTNFVGSNNLFKELDWKKIERETKTLRIDWRFNPPSAAWWGGWWERLVRSTKDLLKRSCGQSRLNYIQLQTCLSEVEATINGRPLTYLTEDVEDLSPLTPSLFIQDIEDCEFPEVQVLDGEGLRNKHRALVKLREELRSRFRTEYLSHLVHRSKAKKCEEFLVGDMVWVSSDNRRRLEWPMGKIAELLPGSDGKTRLARVKTATGMFLRPLQRLIPMEVHSPVSLPIPPQDKMDPEDPEEETADLKEGVAVTTRSGRSVKTPDRLRY